MIELGCTVPMTESVPLEELFSLTAAHHPAATLVLSRHSSSKYRNLDRAADTTPATSYWLIPTELVGDTPTKYHPGYIAAILSVTNPSVPITDKTPIPRIEFTSDADLRRSMTLNGMRMTLEFVQTGSRRMLELIENRLKLGQRDIVHNVLVYLMSQVWDIRDEARGERALRAESVAAFLGLDEAATATLFTTPILDAKDIAKAIVRGDAGKQRRDLAPGPLIENQVALLQPQLDRLQQKEHDLLLLIAEVVGLLKRKQ
jgi:hypothetical protein